MAFASADETGGGEQGKGVGRHEQEFFIQCRV